MQADTLRRRAALLLGIITVVAAVAGMPPARASEVEAAHQVSVLPAGAGWTAGWNSAAFMQDNLWTQGDRQYAIWIGPGGEPIVGRRTLPNGTWTTKDLSSVAGNALRAPTVANPHRVYAIAVDGAGYIHIAGNMHSSSLQYIRSAAPGDIQSWVAGKMVGKDEGQMTYPVFVSGPGGSLLFFYRDGSSDLGSVLLNRLDPKRQRWQRVARVLDGRPSNESPYFQHVVSDGRGRLDLMILWREGRSADGNSDVSYIRSRNAGVSWQDVSGTTLRLPVTHVASRPMSPPGGAGTLLNQGGLAVDDAGRPHGVYRIRGTASKVLHVWHTGQAWRMDEVDLGATLAGRPALVNDGAGTIQVLWAARESLTQSAIQLTPLHPVASPSRRLATVPLGDWEPTFDTSAVACCGRLSLLVPTTATTVAEGQSGTVAVATYDLRALIASEPATAA
jgi:hypothetical protein